MFKKPANNRAPWNERVNTLLSDTGPDWLNNAKRILGALKPRSSLSPLLSVAAMTKYLNAAATVPPTPDIVLPVQRFIEHLAAQPERVLFDNPRAYPDASGLYLIKKLPAFFKKVEASPEQSALFSRAVAAADKASIRLLERLRENCGLLQSQSTEGFLKNDETYYTDFLRHCRDALLKYEWTPDDKKALHHVWHLYQFKGVSGTPQEQREEENTLSCLAALLPDSFETIVSFPYANASGGKGFTPRMLDTLAAMDMRNCHVHTRSQLLGNWCNEQNAGWTIIQQRYPDYALAVDLHRGLLGNMAHYDHMQLMESLWQKHATGNQVAPLTLGLPIDLSDGPT